MSSYSRSFAASAISSSLILAFSFASSNCFFTFSATSWPSLRNWLASSYLNLSRSAFSSFLYLSKSAFIYYFSKDACSSNCFIVSFFLESSVRQFIVIQRALKAQKWTKHAELAACWHPKAIFSDKTRSFRAESTRSMKSALRSGFAERLSVERPKRISSASFSGSSSWF